MIGRGMPPTRISMLLLASTVIVATHPVAFGQSDQTEAASPQNVDQTTSTPIDVDALMARVRARLERIDQATRERDKALEFLENQIDAAATRISGTGQTNDSLRSRTVALNTEVEDLARDRDRLNDEVSQRETLMARLQLQIASLETQLGDRSSAFEAAEQTVASLRNELDLQQETNSSLESSIDSLRDERQALLTKIGEEEQRTLTLAEELAALKDTNAELKNEVVSRESILLREQEQYQVKIASLNETLEARDTQFAALQSDHSSSVKALGASEEEVEALSTRVALLTEQLNAVESLLATSELQVEDQQGEIMRLGERLNLALAKQVEELSRYRSEFFGRLKDALGEGSAFRVVGDRFVFPSEVLFASGSAEIGSEGQAQLGQLAQTLNDVASKIPPELHWILRVDGHSDRVPITTAAFESNWELSTARAIAVVRELLEMGVPAERLAATGFGEFQPLDPGDSPEAFRRNRRIEFKLTSS